MAAFNKFEQFATDIGLAVHNLGSDTLKVALTNFAPSADNTVFADITEIAAGAGYPAGGETILNSTWIGADGVASLSGDDITFTADGGSMGPFRYVVVYNDSSTSPEDPLIGWADYGSEVTLADSETFTVDFGTSIITLS